MKVRTKNIRNKGTSVRYLIQHSTDIEGISLKQFPSNIFINIFIYIFQFSSYIYSFRKHSKTLVVVCNQIRIFNITNYPNYLKSHNQLEADKLMVLQGANVAKHNSFSKLTIGSPDTNVFILATSVLLPQTVQSNSISNRYMQSS